MNKLNALIEAAKAATPGPWMIDPVNMHLVCKDVNGVYEYLLSVDPSSFCSTETTGEQDDANAALIALANPATILELCALLEKAEEALLDMNSGWKHLRSSHSDIYKVGWDRAGDKADNILAAIKQWKERSA